MCTTKKMVVAMDRDGNTSSVCRHGYWRLGSTAMKKDAGANWVAAAQGADGYRCGWNNGSAGGNGGSDQGSVRARQVQAAVEARVTQGFAMGGGI